MSNKKHKRKIISIGNINTSADLKVLATDATEEI